MAVQWTTHNGISGWYALVFSKNGIYIDNQFFSPTPDQTVIFQGKSKRVALKLLHDNCKITAGDIDFFFVLPQFLENGSFSPKPSSKKRQSLDLVNGPAKKRKGRPPVAKPKAKSTTPVVPETNGFKKSPPKEPEENKSQPRAPVAPPKPHAPVDLTKASPKPHAPVDLTTPAKPEAPVDLTTPAKPEVQATPPVPQPSVPPHSGPIQG